MRKLEIRAQGSGISKKNGVGMWNACVQTTNNLLHASGISSEISHRAAYKNNSTVHKHRVYALTRVQVTRFSLYAFTRHFRLFNRLLSKLIPTIHRAYYYPTTSFNLRKI